MRCAPIASAAAKETRGIFPALRSRFRREIDRHNLFPPGSRVLVAVSGGQDSLALSELLRDHQARSAPTKRWEHLALAHTDHCWPGDAGCADHVASYALGAGLALHVADPGAGAVAHSEAAARAWRYRALASIAREHGYTRIAVGHTMSDLAETLVFNLTHGAGADGLSSLRWARAMPEAYCVRDSDSEGCVPVVTRPLLSTMRGETAALCLERGVAVWDDVYNGDSRYARYHTRNVVLPYLRKHYNPRVDEALARTSHLLRDDSAALEAVARDVYSMAIRPDDANTVRMEGTTCISRLVVGRQPVAIQRRVFRMVLEKGGMVSIRTPVFKQVECLVDLVEASNGTKLPSLPGAGSAHVEGDFIVVTAGEGLATFQNVDMCSDVNRPVHQKLFTLAELASLKHINNSVANSYCDADRRLAYKAETITDSVDKLTKDAVD